MKQGPLLERVEKGVRKRVNDRMGVNGVVYKVGDPRRIVVDPKQKNIRQLNKVRDLQKRVKKHRSI